MRVLLVSIPEPSLRTLRPVLEALGCPTPRQAATTADAMAQAASQDLILAGSSEGVDGVEVIRELSRMAPRTPSILIDHDGSPARVIEALRAGAGNFITEPWTPDLLHQRIAETLSRADRRAG